MTSHFGGCDKDGGVYDSLGEPPLVAAIASSNIAWQCTTMLTPHQVRSHRRFERNFQGLLEAAEARRYGSSNQWMRFERLSVYLRISRRVLVPLTSRDEFYDNLVQCVDIANVSTEPRYQHKGMFTRLVNKLHELTDMPLYLENAHMEFATHLMEHYGWKMIRHNMGYSYDLVQYRPYRWPR